MAELKEAAVSDSHVVVPREPTEEMLSAGLNARIDAKSKAFDRANIHSYDDSQAVYRAMIAAAPPTAGTRSYEDGIRDAAKIARKAGNFGDYRYDELTTDFGQPRFDMMNVIVVAIEALSSQGEKLEGDGWQDISTAPKDGTKFLAYWAHSVNSCRWGDGPYDRKAKRYTGGWSIGMARDANPTHWRPLPEPPRQTEGVKP